MTLSRPIFPVPVLLNFVHVEFLHDPFATICVLQDWLPAGACAFCEETLLE